VAAAARLFVERGYVGASIEDVAAEAGVSRATVFNSVGGKLTLLRAAYDVAIVGDDEDVPLPQRPEAQAVIAEADRYEAVEKYATMVTRVNERVVGIYEAFRSAAGADPSVRDEWDAIQRERLGGAHGFVRILAAKGPLRPDLDQDRAGDVVWTLIDASLYQRLVVEREWPTEEFRTWLANRMKDELLPDKPRRAPKKQR
jgi:AcrR family transcriptional regulator